MVGVEGSRPYQAGSSLPCGAHGDQASALGLPIPSPKVLPILSIYFSRQFFFIFASAQSCLTDFPYVIA